MLEDWAYEQEEGWTLFEFECNEFGQCTGIRGYQNNEPDSAMSAASSSGPPFPIDAETIFENQVNVAKLFKSLDTGTLPETLVKIVPDYRVTYSGYPRILGAVYSGYQWRRDANDWHPSIRDALEAGCPVKVWKKRNEATLTGSVVLYATATADPDNPGGLPTPPALPVLTTGAISRYDYFKTGDDVVGFFPGWSRIENYDEPDHDFDHTFILTVSFGVRQSVSFIDHNTPEPASELTYHYDVIDDDRELAFTHPLNAAEATNFGVVHESVYATHGADAVHENRVQIPIGASTEFWRNDAVSFSLDQPTSDLPLIVGVNSLAGYPLWNLKISRSSATNRRQVNSQRMDNPAHIRSLFGEGQSLTGTSIHTSFTSLLICDSLGKFDLTVFPSEFEGADTPEAAWSAIKNRVGDWGSAWLFKAVTFARARIQIESAAAPSTIDINESGDGFFQGDLLHFIDADTKEVIGEAVVSADAANSVVPLAGNALPALPVNTQVYVQHLGDTRYIRFLNFYRSHHASGVGWTVQITPGGGNVLQQGIQ